MTSAKRTIAAAKELIRDGFSDWLVLKSGDVFDEGIGYWCASGASPSSPVVITSSDTMAGLSSSSLPQPLLRIGAENAFYAGNNCPGNRHSIHNLVISGIHFEGSPAWEGTGISIYSSDISQIGHHHILLEDLTINRLRGGIGIQGTADRGSVISGFGRNQYITVRRSRVFDIGARYQAGTIETSNGIFMHASDHILMHQVLMDQNGWQFDPISSLALYNNMNSHNLYANENDSTDVVLTENISSRASATGFRGCVGVCNDNLFLRNPTAMGGGTDVREVRNNVILDAQDIYNPNYPSVGGCLPAGRCERAFGMGFELGPNTQITGNIVAHNQHGTGNINAMSVSGDLTNLEFANNTVYRWEDPQSNASTFATSSAFKIGNVSSPSTLSGVRIHHNTFYQPQNEGLIFLDPFRLHATPAGAVAFSSNAYFSPSSYTFLDNAAGWLTAALWRDFANDNSSTAAVSLARPERSTMATYLIDRTSIAPGSDDIGAFLNEARLQRRGNWNSRFKATSVNQYIRSALALNAQNLCLRIDLDQSGQINIQDMSLFQNFFGAGDLRADMDSNGLLNVLDFMAFLNAFASCSG